MYNRKISVVVSSMIFGLAALHAETSDLGTIQIESTTIDDKIESKKNEPSSVATVSGAKVEESKAENIQKVLQSIPGITTEVQSGDSLKIHIRGVENQRFMGEKPGVAIVIDGVPVFERTGRVNIDLDNIESIKVIKGGASYLFGDDALSGAVIITTKKGAQNAGGKFEVESGTYGYKKYLAKYGVSKDSYNAYLQASKREKEGFYEDSEYKTDYINGKVQYYVDDTSDVTAGFEYSDRKKNSHGTVTGETEAEINPESIWTEGNDGVRDYSAMYDVKLLKMFATYAKNFDENKNLLVNVYQYGDDTNFYSAYAKYDGDHEPVTDPSFKPNYNEYEQIQRGIKSEFRDAFEKSAYMVGVDLRKNEYDNKTSYAVDWATYNYRTRTWTDYEAGTVTGDSTTDESVYAIYGEYKYALTPTWSLTTNLRYDKIELDYLDYLNALTLDKSFDQYSYRAGLNNQLNDHTTFYTSFSTGFRAPSIEQLFYGDIDPTGGTDSNPNLKPEESRGIDIGVRGTSAVWGKNFSYEAGLFRIERDDYIMSSSGQYASEDDVNSQFQNIGGMRSQGLELALYSDISETLSCNVAYTYTDAVFTKYDNFNLLLGNPWGAYTIEHYDLKGNEVPRVPKHHLNFAMNYKFNDKLTLSPEIDAISPYYADELNWIQIPGHAVANLNIAYDTKINGLDTSIYARVDNFFDKEYYNTARSFQDSDADGDYDREDMSIVVNEGRIFTFGVQVKF